jgi:gamma-glutamyl:cysteine ligase YbdK (ATP-grasp superfamily)
VSTYYYNFPAFADLDDDGDEDLLVGEYYGMFQYFENTEFTTGIAENPGEVVFDLYPNPASEEVYLRLMDNIQKSSLEFVIYNLAGVAVKTGSVSNNITKLETGNLAPGMYLVKVIFNNKAFARKLAVK